MFNRILVGSTDFFEQFAPKCGRCEGSILENFISALNRQWHPQCFVCFVSSVCPQLIFIHNPIVT